MECIEPGGNTHLPFHRGIVESEYLRAFWLDGILN